MDTKALTKLMIDNYGGEWNLAGAVGVSQSTINRWAHGGELKGKNLFKLMDLALKFQNTSEIVIAERAMTPTDAFRPDIMPGRDLVGARDFPVYAAAMGGDGHQIVTFDAIDYVKRPTILEHVRSGYGIYIVGDSMAPAFEPGDMALVNPTLPPARDRNAVLYHVTPEGGTDAEAIVKRLTGFNERDWMLRQFNPARDFTEARADWPVCHRIVGKYEAR